MNKQIEALKMAIQALEGIDECYWEHTVLQACKEALSEAEKQEPVAWMEEYQSCKVSGDERLCHSDKVFRLVQLLASQLSECQSLCAKYAEETVKNGEQKLKEVTAIKEALEKAEKREPVAWIKDWADGSKELTPANYDGSYPVYRHPATWQSLSDDEIAKVFDDTVAGVYGEDDFWFRFACAIEQALKEKNHG